MSVITYGLIKKHGFVDGNKRIGVSIMLLLLRISDIQIHYTQNELAQLGLGIADGSLDKKEINKWIKNHIL
ncbi:MAG TPA: type II toxin-antitoxin system death-on-curing family toxin [Clostridia bacterium]|nr:type II toxin-antitoxin system death-on-curing family toxin [Clostridia bacterium]HZJ83277.1 type II toxin-antitoxin system death-on-curing family toxin [Clostridia bacterium]